MKTLRVSSYMKRILPLIALLVVPFSIPAFAQEQSGSSSTTQTAPAQQGGASQTRRETTTVTSQTRSESPVQSVTRTTGIDPLWLIVGGAALLALLVIVALSMRGRSHDHVNTVRERTTVIKE